MSENPLQNDQNDPKGSTSALAEYPPIILFLPGLGADHRLFDAQSAQFATSIALDWLDIRKNETMDEYARRLVDSLPKGQHSYIICGDSLGGMIAPRVAQFLDTRYCVLISSIDNPSRLPLLARVLCALAIKSRVLFYVMAGSLKLLGKLLQPVFSLFLPWYDKAAVDQFLDMPVARFYGMLKLLYGAIKERTSAEQYVSCPIISIHGNRDRVIPIRYTQPDYILDGGHLIIMPRADEINEIIAQLAEKSITEPFE
ncbi:MAG: alpha/beta hydrolase [Planctomycetia bacterium]|nr:alpha/beta hydrolase [Planctomycetia bacterium]